MLLGLLPRQEPGSELETALVAEMIQNPYILFPSFHIFHIAMSQYAYKEKFHLRNLRLLWNPQTFF